MDLRYTIIVFIILVFVTEVYLKDCEPHISITEGPITGKKLKTNKDTQFYAFLDIPYAKPPVGKLRLQESRPAEKWSQRLNATENKKVCMQFSPTFNDSRETEDCLVLNIYVPGETFCQRRETFLPVLLFIHGGSFRSWFGTMDAFGPQYFIDENVLVVAINYRLGPLGFLASGDKVIPGNLALKDQVLAIKWVSKHIKAFGGNPNRITLMGQSAGAIAVGYHLLNPQNKGLFSAAIMQSQSPISCAAKQKYPKDAAYLFASEIDKNFKETNTTKELLKLLQGASLEDLKKNSFFQMPADKLNCQRLSALTWVPSTESKKSDHAVTCMNYEKIKKGYTLKVPLLIGFNSQESLYYGTQGLPMLAYIYDANSAAMINGNLNIPTGKRAAAGQALKALYTNTTFIANVSNLVNFNSDNYFNIPTLAYGYFHSKHSDVYFYRFAFKGLLGQLNSSLPGVGHGEDLNYFFQNSDNKDLSKYSKEEVTTHERLVALWSQFIHHRNPTKTTNKLMQNVKWPKFTQETQKYLNIDEKLIVKEKPAKLHEWFNILKKFATPRIDTL